MKLSTEYLDKIRIEYTIDVSGYIKISRSLDLRGTAITTLPEDLTVGGYLDLQNTAITALPEGLTVGGSLDLQNTAIAKRKYSADVPLSLKNKKIINADGIWGRIISQKGRLAKVKIFGHKEVSFLATSDDGNIHAHGKTATEAMTELAFKMADKGDLSDLNNMPLDTVKTTHEWGLVYRCATGACKMGVDNFITSSAKKESYTLQEILEETSGAFGHEKFKEIVA